MHGERDTGKSSIQRGKPIPENKSFGDIIDMRLFLAACTGVGRTSNSLLKINSNIYTC